MQEIYKEMLRCKRLGLEGVLGTIISTEGSTYQKSGAKCFIAGDGQLTGLVSGGCVEDDLKMIAFDVIEKGKPDIVHYDFRGEGDLLWGLGLGCNGKMNILLELYSPNRAPAKTKQMEEWFERGAKETLHSITIVEAEDSNLIGSKWIINTKEPNYHSIPFQEILDDYLNNIDTIPGCSLVSNETDPGLQVYYDVISPDPTIAIFGAGPDAVPLVQLAKTLKWTVKVLDHRPAYVNESNFPEADELICYPKNDVPDISINENTYVVIMSHHFMQDQLILKEVLDSDAPYIGVLGPRKRMRELSKGFDIANHPNLYKTHSPIGLDIGSETPEEIALSIIGEITAVYRGGSGNKLTTLKGAMDAVES